MYQGLSKEAKFAGSRNDWREHFANLFATGGIHPDLSNIANKIATSERLSIEDGLFLFRYPNLNSIGQLADMIKQSRFGDNAFFNHNVHVNQTNICVLACKFCAFRRSPKEKDAYAMSVEDYLAEVGRYADFVDEVHSVGGLHPKWKVEHYEKLFSMCKSKFPSLQIKALTAVEIKHLATQSDLTVEEILSRLHSAGLDSLPGGGAEILDDEIRDVICRGKESSQEYLDIHHTAHKLGIPTNCTMLFGTIENSGHRVKHLLSLRDLQEKSEGFQCFVPYPYLPDSSRLPQAQLASGSEILRVIAVSRIMLDNIPHVKAYRMNISDGIAELALRYGADDIDGTVQQESIMHLAGSTTPLTHNLDDLSRLIRGAGCIPIQRNTRYTKFTEYDVPEPIHKRLPMAL